ncbi:hypothetical protein [Desulfofundulus thermobenzoicus]|uniref:hypothetical protein n=1 Tax=Desulfofundulus thermobenzoicus TaxID=29376 RepID=UPI00128EC877|nr:hypothetical protein [Desulfofundulus thermobenzoicus]
MAAVLPRVGALRVLRPGISLPASVVPDRSGWEGLLAIALHRAGALRALWSDLFPPPATVPDISG